MRLEDNESAAKCLAADSYPWKLIFRKDGFLQHRHHDTSESALENNPLAPFFVPDGYNPHGFHDIFYRNT